MRNPMRLRPDEPLIRIKPGFDCRRRGTRAPWDRPQPVDNDIRMQSLNSLMGLGAANLGGVFGNTIFPQMDQRLAQQNCLRSLNPFL